jgi:hypothetical protein
MSVSTAGVALIATVHDPDNRLLALTQATLPALQAAYRSISVLCSAATHFATVNFLDKSGVAVRKEARRPSGHQGLGRVRREALQMGLASGAAHLHLCDFDRALHWMAHFPDELHAMLADLPQYDFLIMGRSARAWDTHPPVQKVTEELTNLVFAKIYGQEVDIAGGSRGLSRQAARLLSIHSREETVGVDGEWPVLLKRFPELKRGYRAYDGLEFETADEREEEIAAAGGQAAWEEKVLDSPEAWLLRIEVTHDTIAAAVRAGQSSLTRPGGRPA